MIQSQTYTTVNYLFYEFSKSSCFSAVTHSFVFRGIAPPLNAHSHSHSSNMHVDLLSFEDIDTIPTVLYICIDLIHICTLYSPLQGTKPGLKVQAYFAPQNQTNNRDPQARAHERRRRFCHFCRCCTVLWWSISAAPLSHLNIWTLRYRLVSLLTSLFWVCVLTSTFRVWYCNSSTFCTVFYMYTILFIYFMAIP